MNFEAALYNCDGEKILCACGNPSVTSIIGKEAYQAFCQECSPFFKVEPQEMIYKPNMKAEWGGTMCAFINREVRNIAEHLNELDKNND